MSYTQFKRLWQCDRNPTPARNAAITAIEDGKRVEHTVKPVMWATKAAHNGNVVYSLDFEVAPRRLRHLYITNHDIMLRLMPKTVQLIYARYMKDSKITMDMYAKVKYNRTRAARRSAGRCFCSRWD